MSINEIIKKCLPLSKQKLIASNNQYNYCFAYSYQNCNNCKEIKRIKCSKKIIYKSFKQINDCRWHFYFFCLNHHLVVRWVNVSSDSVLVGQIKN